MTTDLLPGHRAALDPRLEIAALEQLHHQKRLIGGGVDAGVERLDQVLAGDLGRHARLEEEARAHRVVAQQRREHHLEGATTGRVAVDHLVDRPHAAVAEHADDLVSPREHGPRCEQATHGVASNKAHASLQRRRAGVDRAAPTRPTEATPCRPQRSSSSSSSSTSRGSSGSPSLSSSMIWRVSWADSISGFESRKRSRHSIASWRSPMAARVSPRAW